MKKIIIILSALFSNHLFAASNNSSLTIGPIIGYEKVYRYAPEQRSVSRLTYGLRAVYGVPLLSAELQVTQAKSNEDLPKYSMNVKETATIGMLGLKSSFAVLQAVSWYLRAGGHGSKSEITETIAGVSTTKNPGLKVSPYAGTGLNINIFNKVRLDAGMTAIFPKASGQKYDYQGTLGFSINI